VTCQRRERRLGKEEDGQSNDRPGFFHTKPHSLLDDAAKAEIQVGVILATAAFSKEPPRDTRLEPFAGPRSVNQLFRKVNLRDFEQHSINFIDIRLK
jgi:hypothetical protein